MPRVLPHLMPEENMTCTPVTSLKRDSQLPKCPETELCHCSNLFPTASYVTKCYFSARPSHSGEDGKSRKSDVLSCLSSQLAVRKTTNQQRVTSMSELDRLHRSQVYPPARGLYSLRVIAFISSQK
ncbi:hypothetical protein TNCV_1937472 [Trichonephila clavipes]|nr:hypothetical protein TNCV_1937472 [Trichonephila clavipes]